MDAPNICWTMQIKGLTSKKGYLNKIIWARSSIKRIAAKSYGRYKIKLSKSLRGARRAKRLVIAKRERIGIIIDLKGRRILAERIRV